MEISEPLKVEGLSCGLRAAEKLGGDLFTCSWEEKQRWCFASQKITDCSFSVWLMEVTRMKMLSPGCISSTEAPEAAEPGSCCPIPTAPTSQPSGLCCADQTTSMAMGELKEQRCEVIC
ncbi:uncharacterized protein M6G45_000351 isoform 1-T1 [Spheniscus humboldti]